MLTPGFVPTNTHIKFGSKMSTSGERWAYLEGSAYLLDLRCFFARRGADNDEDDVADDVVLVATVSVGRDRFAPCRGNVDGSVSLFLIELSSYWYFDKCPLNEVVGGDDNSGGSERSLEDSVGWTITADLVRAIPGTTKFWYY